MSISVKITRPSNQKKVNGYLNKLGNQMNDKVLAAALIIQGEAKALISRGSRSGIVYKRGLKTHQASAPGEPPKTDSGRLVQSIGVDQNISDSSARTGTNVKHGTHLEFGTKNMGARPWLQPATEIAKSKIKVIFKREVK